MQIQPISVRLTEDELLRLDFEAKKANLSRSEYIRKNLFNNAVQIVYMGEEFYQSLRAIDWAIKEVERNTPKVDCSKIREEVVKACQLFNY
ncbi:plasmid mobilization protein [Lacrimispora celerecrescens]|uniref:plasmid mobilization protein n=1 Tax=Lacrimispora celerecrescens TaxID=29354 RepID=UPI0016473555|nr:hypothetical protein [Lacrimispora celerecrescens]